MPEPDARRRWSKRSRPSFSGGTRVKTADKSRMRCKSLVSGGSAPWAQAALSPLLGCEARPGRQGCLKVPSDLFDSGRRLSISKVGAAFDPFNRWRSPGGATRHPDFQAVLAAETTAESSAAIREPPAAPDRTETGPGLADPTDRADAACIGLFREPCCSRSPAAPQGLTLLCIEPEARGGCPHLLDEPCVDYGPSEASEPTALLSCMRPVCRPVLGLIADRRGDCCVGDALVNPSLLQAGRPCAPEQSAGATWRLPAPVAEHKGWVHLSPELSDETRSWSHLDSSMQQLTRLRGELGVP